MVSNNYTIDYLAGIYDGEGSACIRVSNRKNRPNQHFTATVTVGNTFKPVVVWFKNKYGGNISIEKKMKGTVVYRWGLSGGNKIRRFIKDFINHTHIKRKELLVLEEFLDYSQRIRASRPRNLEYDKTILINFIKYRDKLRELHSSPERYDDPTS